MLKSRGPSANSIPSKWPLLSAFALVAGRLIESMVYGIRPQDPLTIGAAVVLLTGAALLAALIPALRSSRVDPLTALREE